VTDDLDAPDALDRDKALTLAAVAAMAWCARGSDSAPQGPQVLERVMKAASWVSRTRRHNGLPAIGVANLVAAFSEPVEAWLPGGGSFVLIENGQLTPIGEDLADDAGGWPLAEVEQNVIRVAMNNLRGRIDEEAAYTAFRRFLVENAHAKLVDAAAALRQVGIDLARVYQRVPASTVAHLEGGEAFYPCPRCGWPMHIQGSAVSCHRSPTCIAAGARFDLESSLVGLGKLTPPPPVSPEGVAALLPGIWRFTVLPGLEELALERLLRQVEGVEVRLWPFVDAYDLDVRRGPHHWRIDLKDHSSVTSLARHLKEHPVSEPTWIVVPEARREQVPRLRQLVDRDAQYIFADVREIVRRVKEAE